MRIGIISDIHGNIEALTAVLDALKKAQPDQLICLGDLVGYGPNPNECIALIQEHADVVIAGNHDFAALQKISTESFNSHARTSIFWTMRQLTPESIDYLSGLPLTVTRDQFMLVHATPNAPEDWHYILSIYDAYDSFLSLARPLCFCGHSHVPVIVIETAREQFKISMASRLKIKAEARYLINIGSVGQPRDYDPRAAYALYDTDTARYELHRVTYDVAAVQAKMKRAKLPSFLISRLALGQ